jgi:hypothetical protein
VRIGSSVPTLPVAPVAPVAPVPLPAALSIEDAELLVEEDPAVVVFA